MFITAGTVNDTKDLTWKAHIFKDQKPDYYDINDPSPKYNGNVWDDPSHEPTKEEIEKSRIKE